ncbi:MAG: hypothetical protein ACRDAM_04100 [Casimicrobium sp.]
MPRGISGGFETKLSADGTTPGYLLEIGFSPVVRWSSLTEFPWNSQTWLEKPFSVSGFGINGTAESSGSVSFNNHDNEIGTLCLAEGVANKTFKLYSLDGIAPASDEARLIFDGLADGFTLNSRRVTITALLRGKQSKKIPSLRITRSAIRQVITRPKTRVQWNGETFIIDNPKK